MVKSIIVWTQFAASELKSIYQFYKHNASITVARNIKERIYSSVKQLHNHPLSGAIENNLTDSEYKYRYLVENNYKIIYRYHNNNIYIVDIFDCRRNPEEMKLSTSKK